MKVLFLMKNTIMKVSFLVILLNFLQCQKINYITYKDKNKNRTNLIVRSIREENIDVLDSLSASEINRQFRDEKVSFTINPFQFSLIHGSKDIIKFMLDKGGNPNILTYDYKNWMDLFFIDRKKENKDEKVDNKIEIIKYIIDKKGAISSKLKGRGLIYYLAIQNDFTRKNYDMIIDHVKDYIDFNNIGHDYNSRITPFNASVLTSNVDFMNILIKYGATTPTITIKELLKDRDNFDKNLVIVPILYAITTTKPKILNILIENKINLEFIEEKVLKKIIVLPSSNSGNEEDKIEVLRKLLKVKRLSKELLSEVLINAIKVKNEKIVSYLLSLKNIDIDVNVYEDCKENLSNNSLRLSSRKKISVISFAVRNNNIEIVKELIKKGANIESDKIEHIPPIFLTIRGAIKLKEDNLDYSVFSYDENTALEILKILKEGGANLNKKLYNLSLLETAVRTNCQKIAKYLLDQEVDLPTSSKLRNSSIYTDSIIFEQGELFIEIFEKMKKREFLKNNKKNLFKVELRNGTKINLLNLATQVSNERIVEYLIEQGDDPFEKNISENFLYSSNWIEELVELFKSDKLENNRRIKIEKNLNSLDLAIQNTSIPIFDIILLKGSLDNIENNREKIISFIRKNLIFSSKTFIINTRQGYFGILKFILKNIENEFKDLQSYVNYVENGETSLDILNNFFSNQKEIINLFKQNSAFKFNEILEMEKEREKKTLLTYLILNEKFEDAFAKIESKYLYKADENNITPLIASVIVYSKNRSTKLAEISYNLLIKILDNTNEKQEINRIDINKKNALSYLIESTDLDIIILDQLIAKGASLNFRYGRKYHFIVDIALTPKSWKDKQAIFDVIRKYKEKIVLTKKDIQKLNKFYNLSKEKNLMLKSLDGILDSYDLVIEEKLCKTKVKEMDISYTRKTDKFRKNFDNTSSENQKIILEEIENLKNNRADVKLILGLNTKVWEIRKNKIRIFYFINNSTLFLIDIVDNKHQDSLPNAYYKNLAFIKKEMLFYIDTNEVDIHIKF